jgi:hypothetical protein
VATATAKSSARAKGLWTPLDRRSARSNRMTASSSVAPPISAEGPGRPLSQSERTIAASETPLMTSLPLEAHHSAASSRRSRSSSCRSQTVIASDPTSANWPASRAPVGALR